MVANVNRLVQTYDVNTQAGQSGNLALKVSQCRKIVKQLLKLCNYPIKGNTKHLSLLDVFPALQQCTPCDLVIPVQHSLIASLPPNDVNFASHQPFPSDLPCISSTRLGACQFYPEELILTFSFRLGFIDKISVMPSMQKPRKIGIIGTDGKTYPFLCKPKDDLRKDARLMEFNSMINKLLKKDSESRRRNLRKSSL
jgi:serine/threonine-protein kinase ATR